jgi:hypothetical protein
VYLHPDRQGVPRVGIHTWDLARRWSIHAARTIGINPAVAWPAHQSIAYVIDGHTIALLQASHAQETASRDVCELRGVRIWT